MRVVTEMYSELGSGVVCDVGGHTECLRDGICLESELEVGKGVPLHPPPFQGSDVSALLTIMFEKGWPRSPRIIYVEGLRGVSDEIP